MAEPLDPQEYREKSDHVVAYGSLCLVVAMAKETGIAKVLFETDTPLSSSEIARRAGLKERYVREVLHAVVSAGLVQLTSERGENDAERTQQDQRYSLLQQHRDTFWEMAVSSLQISCAARIFTSVKRCFAVDGPSSVPYDPSFFDLVDERRKLDLNDVLDAVLKTPGLSRMLEDGAEVVEVGCGPGRLLLRMAAMFPKSQFAITDAAQEPLMRVEKMADAEGLENLVVEVADLCNLPEQWNERFDWLIAQEVIHDLPDPQRALDAVFQSLRPGGHFSLLEIFVSSDVAKNVGHTEAAMRYSLSAFYCLPQSYQTPDSPAFGACWGEEKAREMLEKAGFEMLGVTRSDRLGAKAVCMCQKV